jgi:mannose-1-phosphate guanylyltransferase
MMIIPVIMCEGAGTRLWPASRDDETLFEKPIVITHADAFIEMPDAERAAGYVAKGHLWDSGNLLFDTNVMLGEIDRWAPDIANAARAALNEASRDLDFSRRHGRVRN